MLTATPQFESLHIATGSHVGVGFDYEEKKEEEEWGRWRWWFSGLESQGFSLQRAPFSDSGFLGEDRAWWVWESGTVFQAELLGSSTCVAVKCLERPGREEREFRAVVCTIGNIQHLNLVRLKSFSLSSNGVYFSINVYNTETTVFWENKSEPSIFLQQLCCSYKLPKRIHSYNKFLEMFI